MSDVVIKTTATIHEASEPSRYKPIVRIDDKNGNTTISHISNSNELANTIRASIDSGRDNPFRPDGEIYKMTDPIVDFYKFGPNQSRSQTPTYGELTPSKSSQPSKHNRLRWRKKSSPNSSNNNNDDDDANRDKEARSCWRKWFCCCCCCFKCCCKKETDKRQQAPLNGTARPNESQISSNIDYYNRVQAPEDLMEQNKQRQQIGGTLSNARSPAIKIDSTDSKSQLQTQPQARLHTPHQSNGNDPIFKQTRVVILRDDKGEQELHHNNLDGLECTDSGTNKGKSKSKRGGDCNNNKNVKEVETVQQVRLARSKTSTSKCSIS